MTQTRWTLALFLMLGLAATPAMADHKHRRGCGHAYSRAHGGWVSVAVATPHFGFSFSRAPLYDPYGYDDRYYRDRDYDRGYRDRYWDPYYYDSGYDRHRGYWKHHDGHRHGYKGRCR